MFIPGFFMPDPLYEMASHPQSALLDATSTGNLTYTAGSLL